MRFRDADNCACFFCGGNNRVQVVARDDGAATFAVCVTCREKIMTAWSSDVTLTKTAHTYSEATKQVMSEAAAMTEEEFKQTMLYLNADFEALNTEAKALEAKIVANIKTLFGE